MFPVIFKNSMGLRKSRCGVLSGTTQGWAYPREIDIVSLVFVQIWKLQGYGQYNIKGNIINVPTNIYFTQSILLHLPQDETTIGLSLKRQMEYKSPYLTSNVCSNLIMTILHDLFNTLHYKFKKLHGFVPNL
jgi:hypothetical protein